MTASVMRTLEAAFPWVQIFPQFIPGPDADSGNISIIAGTGKLLGDLPALDESNIHPFAREGVRKAWVQHYAWKSSNEGIILTDDYNPLDVLDLPLKETIRHNILNGTPHEILLSDTNGVSKG
jgi:hypothetical protein